MGTLVDHKLVHELFLDQMSGKPGARFNQHIVNLASSEFSEHCCQIDAVFIALHNHDFSASLCQFRRACSIVAENHRLTKWLLATCRTVQVC